jgi:hypothetical protein
MGNPFEWLRSMARRSGDDDELVGEAAHALGALGDDPAGLVVAARRLLAHHRHHGGLWWLVSHLLCAPEPAAAARACQQRIDGDRTVARLAGALELQGEGERLGVAGWSDAIDGALAERPDLDVLAVIDDDTPSWSMRRVRTRADVIEPWQLADMGVTLLVVGAHAIGPRAALVDAVVLDAVAEAGRADVWVVAPLARILPARLADAVAAGVRGDEALAWLELGRVDRVAGPNGVEVPAEAVARVDCPIAAELLRPLD